MPLGRLERHPRSSRAFPPLAAGTDLVVAAPDRDGAPEEDAIRAFLVPGSAGISDVAGT